jgi:hypothetical protein
VRYDIYIYIYMSLSVKGLKTPNSWELGRFLSLILPNTKQIHIIGQGFTSRFSARVSSVLPSVKFMWYAMKEGLAGLRFSQRCWRRFTSSVLLCRVDGPDATKNPVVYICRTKQRRYICRTKQWRYISEHKNLQQNCRGTQTLFILSEVGRYEHFNRLTCFQRMKSIKKK